MKRSLLGSLLVLPVSAGALLAQTPVNLNTWTPQWYSPGQGSWTVAPDGNSVLQTENGEPTLFASDFLAQGTEVKGTIRVVNASGDNDFIGFALGYRLNDPTNGDADYLLVDWKQGTQTTNFGGASTVPGGVAPRGMAVSRVTGIPMADEFWQHENLVGNPNGGVQELQRANTLGDLGWLVGVDYEFTFLFQSNLLQVWVNDVLELSVNGSFSDGSLAFYNFSQANVRYSAFTVEQVSTVPEPASVVLVAAGLAAVGIVVRRRRSA